MLQVLKTYAECGIITVTEKERVKQRVAAVDDVDRYNVSDISRAISKLKRNKSPGADMLYSEHFTYLSDKLHVMLTMLFNSKI